MDDKNKWKFSPFFDQEDPQCPIVGMIADLDQSASYELDAMAVFECDGGRYLVVAVSGCSCWPDRGGTSQTVCGSIPEVEQAVKSASGYQSWSSLIELCQNAKWKATKLVEPVVTAAKD